MKRIFTIISASILYVSNIAAQGSETFTNSALTASYLSSSFVGDNSVTWTYVASRNEDVYGITGKGIMLRRTSDGSKVTSSTVAGGITDFTCKLKKAFTGAGNRQVELFVNGVSKGTSITWDNTITQTFSVTGINVSGGVTIEIRNITANQVIVDDIVWTAAAVLAVDFKSLTASKSNNSNQLAWQTTSEKNNAYFNIERSQNGETFTKIGQVKGNGTSSVAQNYSFTDATPYKGINYYRLRQVDFDGTESVSKTVSVDFDGKGQNKFKVYPTLVQDNLTVELNGEGKSEITVRDLTGRAILTQNTEGPSTQVLNLGGFSNGLYLLSVRSNDGFETVKIQKQ
jgi:Secretion system C-terminal sorting domain